MSSLCLAAGKLFAVVPAAAFTLAWTHSIEKTCWEEDWRIDGDRLSIVDARIRGSGAGMEPGPAARLEDGVWHYRPALPPQPRLRVWHSAYTDGYTLCANERCRPLADYLPGLGDAAVVDLSACPAGTDAPPVAPGAPHD